MGGRQSPPACDFVIAMTERYGENWRIPGSPPLVVLGTEAHFQDLLVRSQCKFGKVLTLRLMVAMPLLLERFLRSFRVALLSAAPRMSHSLPLSLHSTRVRLTARS